MKIFSNFDTRLDNELYREAKERFGDDRVLFVRRDKVYLALKVWVPIVTWFVLSLITLLSFYIYLSGGGFMQYVGGFLWFVVITSGIYLIYKSILKFIDFHMDYTIITPLSVMQYDQTGVLGRSTRSLDISKIRSISIDKQGLLKSLFNYGSIVFFSEGDASFGDITLNYISNPISLRNAIEHIIMLHTSLKEEVVDGETAKKHVSDKIQSKTPESNSEITVEPAFEPSPEKHSAESPTLWSDRDSEQPTQETPEQAAEGSPENNYDNDGDSSGDDTGSKESAKESSQKSPTKNTEQSSQASADKSSQENSDKHSQETPIERSEKSLDKPIEESSDKPS